MSRRFSGAQLRQARLNADLPLEQVALDVARSAYSVQEYERDRVTPPADVLGALADAIGCPVDAFFVPAEVAA